MGPPSLVSAAPSTIGSPTGSSEWGREYEDEDTWYEFSSAYQSGPDAQLMPKKDTGLSLRLTEYQRKLGSEVREVSVSRRSRRSSLKERQDIRDWEKDRLEDAAQDEVDQRHLKHTRRGLWQMRRMMDTENVEEGKTHVGCATAHASAAVCGGSDIASDNLELNSDPENMGCNKALSNTCMPVDRVSLPTDNGHQSTNRYLDCPEADGLESPQPMLQNRFSEKIWIQETKVAEDSDPFIPMVTCMMSYFEDNSCRGLNAPPPTEPNPNTDPPSDKQRVTFDLEDSPVGDENENMKPLYTIRTPEHTPDLLISSSQSETSIPRLAGIASLAMRKHKDEAGQVQTARRSSLVMAGANPKDSLRLNVPNPDSRDPVKRVASWSVGDDSLQAKMILRGSGRSRRRPSRSSIQEIPESTDEHLEFLVAMTPQEQALCGSLARRQRPKAVYACSFGVGIVAGLCVALTAKLISLVIYYAM